MPAPLIRVAIFRLLERECARAVETEQRWVRSPHAAWIRDLESSLGAAARAELMAKQRRMLSEHAFFPHGYLGAHRRRVPSIGKASTRRAAGYLRARRRRCSPSACSEMFATQGVLARATPEDFMTRWEASSAMASRSRGETHVYAPRCTRA